MTTRTGSVPTEGMNAGMEENVAREEGENDQPKKEESEGMKQMKKGASAIGGFFKKGWGAVLSNRVLRRLTRSSRRRRYCREVGCDD